MEKFFKIRERGSNVRLEIIGGLTTFFAMAYIIFVNPNQVAAEGANGWLAGLGADPTAMGKIWNAVYIASILVAIIGTLLMALYARMPFAQACGMGLNAFFCTCFVSGAFFSGADVITGYQTGLVIIFLSGLVFLVLSVTGLRTYIAKALPESLKQAIPAGIGMFIAFIGFQNSGVIVANDYTQNGLVDFTNWGEQIVQAGNPASFAAKTAVVALIGLIAIAVLDKANVKGSVIFGILIATVVGIPFGVTNLSVLKGDGAVSWKFWENFANFFGGESSVFCYFADLFSEGLVPEGGSVFTVIMLIITMCMIDMFDTMGTIVGCCGGNRFLSDENNKPYNYGKIMISDAVATCAGALLGTSTVTTFVESGAGVSAGGRTGLTAFTTACLFLLAIFVMPVFAAIPTLSLPARYSKIAGSKSPVLVPIGTPPRGVKLIDVSTHLPSLTAAIEEPLPR